MKRIVITGIGTINALGHNIEETFDAFEQGKNGIDNIQQIDPLQLEQMNVKLAAEVKDIDFSKHFSKAELKYMDRFSRFALISARQAFNDAGFVENSYNPDRFGVIFSAGLGGSHSIEDGLAKINKINRTSPYFIPLFIPNMAAGLVSMELKLTGHCVGVVSACSSSAHAIMDAARLIKLGELDKVLVGGTEAVISKMSLIGFDSMTALSRSQDKNRASIPFDKERNGFVMGEGAASLILEDYDAAKARGAKIYAELVGYGSTADAEHITAPAEGGIGMVKAINNALEMAKIKPAKINYINAHGTSTPINDKTETAVFKTVFAKELENIAISSTKSMHGHTLGAAGALESLACIFALNNNIIPPTINYKEFDENCDLNITPNKAIKKEVNYALSTSLGFGGHNAALIFKGVK